MGTVLEENRPQVSQNRNSNLCLEEFCSEENSSAKAWREHLE